MKEHATTRRAWAIVAATFVAAAIPLGIVWTLSGQARIPGLEAKAASLAPDSSEARRVAHEIAQQRRDVGFGWVDVGAAAIGAGLLVAAAARPAASRWTAVAAGAPVLYLVLSAASMALARETLPLLRLTAALGGLVSYVGVVWPLPGRLQYGVCCACLGTMAVFFGLWEPPLPKPVPIRKHLSELQADLLKATPGWTGRHEVLPKEVEATLGADEYLNLALTSPDKNWVVTIFVTYNANAMTKVPHVPWVCMTQSGFRLVSKREEDVLLPEMPGRELRLNVMLFDPGEGLGRAQALMFQYFNVGGVYTYNREWTRVLATSGSIGQRGSYLSQTQVAVRFMPGGAEDPTAKGSEPYQLGLKFLSVVVPRLEKEYYPNLHGDGGG